jgi:hypothetical protein
MTILLTEVESSLNSRPIFCLLYSSHELSYLTAGHVLIGEPITALPVPDMTNLPVNRL